MPYSLQESSLHSPENVDSQGMKGFSVKVIAPPGSPTSVPVIHRDTGIMLLRTKNNC